jgi:hypothetical protein
MLKATHCRTLSWFALLCAFSAFTASAASVKTVFVIAMENHNWTQPPAQVVGAIQQIFGNPNAPFINSLVNGSALAIINGSVENISKQVSYATAYHNVPPNDTGASPPAVHPSEPNYLWTEAGTNFGVFNDKDPYQKPGGTNQNTGLHLSNFLILAGKTWRSYQEDIDLTPSSSGLTNVPLPQAQWTVPLSSFSGVFAPGNVNAYNGSNQFNYAAKHNPMVFFTDTNGGNNATPSNPLSTHYAPLQQLETDLANNTVADYNWITPDQYNDMHTSLKGSFRGLTGDSANIAQGDNFLSIIVPMIMASKAYKNQGVIIIWWDETESVNRENENDFSHTLGSIIISSRAQSNVNGVPFASSVNLSHSSLLRTIQLIFGVGPFLNDAANANDMSDLFGPGAIPKKP